MIIANPITTALQRTAQSQLAAAPEKPTTIRHVTLLTTHYHQFRCLLLLCTRLPRYLLLPERDHRILMTITPHSIVASRTLTAIDRQTLMPRKIAPRCIQMQNDHFTKSLKILETLVVSVKYLGTCTFSDVSAAYRFRILENSRGEPFQPPVLHPVPRSAISLGR